MRYEMPAPRGRGLDGGIMPSIRKASLRGTGSDDGGCERSDSRGPQRSAGGHQASATGGHQPSAAGGHEPSAAGGREPSAAGGREPSAAGGREPSAAGGCARLGGASPWQLLVPAQERSVSVKVWDP